MSSRGRPPVPTKVKEMRGTLRKHRVQQNEPAPKSEIPGMPDILDRLGRQEWRRIVPLLDELSLLSRIDRAALTGYCQAYSEFWRMERDIQQFGYTQLSDKGWEAPRPQVAIRDAALKRMHQYLREFGLSPSSRTRLSVPEKEEKDDNPFKTMGL